MSPLLYYYMLLLMQKFKEVSFDIDPFKNVVIIDGIEYPPTEHNKNIWLEYKSTLDKSILKWLTTICLDI